MMAASLEYAEAAPLRDSDNSDDLPQFIAPLAEEKTDDDVFEDAIVIEHREHYEHHGPKEDLQEAFADCEKAMKFFFNNDITTAMRIMQPWCDTSLYHSLGAAIFEFIPAVLTFDRTYLKQANAAIKNCISLCNRLRRQYTFVESLGSIIKKPNFAGYSDIEAHAELCYAEALLLHAAINILEGEDLSSLIKGTLKVKNCYNTYQNCWDIKESKKFDTEASKLHFKSGVRLGTASFNLMISLLPPRIIALLEFVGFSGNKYYGLSELDKGSRCGGMRAVLCDLLLIAYHLIICEFVGGRGDHDLANDIIDRSLDKYPNSVWFLVFKARYHYLRGQLNEGIEIYNHIASCESTFTQFRYICYWELMWVHGLRMDYRKASHFAEVLYNGSAWSKTTHCYIMAAMLMQTSSETSRSDQLTISRLIRDAPRFQQRIGGKSLPMEKFVIKRCQRYRQQCGRLVLPALELLAIWNLFPILQNNTTILQSTLKMVESNTELLDTCEGEWWGGHKGDNKALLLYLHGSCLSASGFYHSAVSKFNEVLKMKRDIKEDTYLLPYAVCEIGWCHYNLGDMERAHNSYIEARKNYSGYSLESRLHFRIHARLQLVRDIIGNTKFPPPPRV